MQARVGWMVGWGGGRGVGGELVVVRWVGVGDGRSEVVAEGGARVGDVDATVV